MDNRQWTDTAHKARNNEYGGRCIVCQREVVPNTGRLVSGADVNGYPTTNGVIHNDCVLPTSSIWHYRARQLHRRTLEELGVENIGVTGKKADVIIFDEASDIPTPAAPEPPKEPTEAELAQAAQEIVDRVTSNFLNEVPGLVRSTLMELTRSVEISIPKMPKVRVENSHKVLPDIVMCAVAGTNPFLVGPAGSGKTTLASQVANVLKRKFYAENRVTSEYKLLGFMDATGKYVKTQFREAYEKGGVFLLDEVDASDPDVLTTFNSALANQLCPFPDKLIVMHKDFVAIAAGNTFGRGADRQYVGRNQLDAATLDRFVIVEVDYDEAAELTWAGNDDWTMYVQKIRSAIEAEKVRHIVSPRASIYGARLLAAGMERDLVIERCVWKGLDATNRQRVVARMGV